MRRLLAALACASLLSCAGNHSWRDRPPELPRDPPVIVSPRLERWSFAGGLPVYHFPRPAETVAIGLALRTGPSVDPALATFTLELVARGPDHAAQDALGEFGGALEVTWLADGALLWAEVDAGAWRPALAAIAAALRDASFTAEDLEELRRERLAAIQRRDGDPARRALDTLARRVAPAHEPLGERASAETWTIEHVRSIHAGLVRPGGLALIVAGPVPRPALRDAAEQAFGDTTPAPIHASPPGRAGGAVEGTPGEASPAPGQGRGVDGPRAAVQGRASGTSGPAWTPADARDTRRCSAPALASRAIRDASAAPRREILVVPRPGLSQTAIVLGRVGPAAGHDLALEAAEAIVASSLREVLRRERGETYSVSVAHVPARTGSLLVIRTQVEAAATGTALRTIVARLRELQGRFMTGDALRLLGQAFQIERMLERQRCADLVDAGARLHVHDLPPDALSADLRAFGALGDDPVEHALKTWFDPDGLQIVLVGDPARIAAQVRPLGLGPLREVN